MCRRSGGRKAFSLIELVAVLAVIGVLLALILPAVQAAREAARRTECRNRLKQWALAFHNHEAAQRTLPSNGWGYWWVGEPDRGTGPRQPGGWIYQLLPFVEQNSLRELGAGQPDAMRFVTLGDLTQRPLPLVRCPTRPAPLLGNQRPTARWWNAEARPQQNRTDYAVNEGDFITGTDRGPNTLAAGDDPNYPWTDVSAATGVCFLRSAVRWSDITDGMSHTYLTGEKQVNSAHYADSGDLGYDQSAFSGVDLDLNRWTNYAPQRDGPASDPRVFGSAHVSGFHMALCDGSVRFLSYSVDELLHRHLGHRSDGATTALP